MRKSMTRGKQQVLFNYLPGRTIDFEGGVIARINYVRGIQARDLNVPMLLSRIQEQASAWPDAFRPGLRDDVLQDPTRFVVLDPRSVEAGFFPRVAACGNPACGRVFDSQARRGQQRRACPACGGRLSQLRFVRVHRCGELGPVTPPRCRQCQSTTHMAIDTRGSERIANFRWICRSCGDAQSFFAGPCRACDWPGPSAARLKLSSIEVHRAGKTFYAHTATLLNVPTARYASLFGAADWKALVSAKFLRMPAVADRRLDELRRDAAGGGAADGGVSPGELDNILQRQRRGEISPQDLVRELEAAQNRSRDNRAGAALATITQDLVRFSGTPIGVWEDAAQELAESILPAEIAQPRNLRRDPPFEGAAMLLDRMGIADVDLLNDFPIVLATYGFSRIEATPRRPGGNDILCQLNPFPQDREHDGRWPIYVDQTTADALLVRLSGIRVVEWLRANGVNVTLPAADNPEAAAKAYVVAVLTGHQLRETLPDTAREARMVFGLLHTLGHMLVKEAALLCGLERTSLAEYLLPRSLTVVIYCNHRSGQGIGALTALFESSMAEWLGSVRGHRRCVYDPVCSDDGSSCHACTHLSETSCRFFNMNLSRAFLFGGHDSELGDIAAGYLDYAP
jgi:hypothetical protein